MVGVGVDAWAVLAAARAGAEQTVAALSRELSDLVEAAAGAATDDEHDPDGSTTAFERAQIAALLTRARGHLVAVEQAEQRLRAGTYGRCQRCDTPIATERLTALPATAHCITCATRRSR
jgi:DnaK suppressor protein